MGVCGISNAQAVKTSMVFEICADAKIAWICTALGQAESGLGAKVRHYGLVWLNSMLRKGIFVRVSCWHGLRYIHKYIK